MALEIKVSQLPSVSALNGPEWLMVVQDQGGGNYDNLKTTLNQLFANINSPIIINPAGTNPVSFILNGTSLSNLFKVDAAGNKVYIGGTASSAGMLNVVGDVNANNVILSREDLTAPAATAGITNITVGLSNYFTAITTTAGSSITTLTLNLAAPVVNQVKMKTIMIIGNGIGLTYTLTSSAFLNFGGVVFNKYGDVVTLMSVTVGGIPYWTVLSSSGATVQYT